MRPTQLMGSQPPPVIESRLLSPVTGLNVTGLLYYCSSSAAVLLDGGSRIMDVRPKFLAWVARDLNHQLQLSGEGRLTGHVGKIQVLWVAPRFVDLT
jgi:hypothetical protein